MVVGGDVCFVERERMLFGWVVVERGTGRLGSLWSEVTLSEG